MININKMSFNWWSNAIDMSEKRDFHVWTKFSKWDLLSVFHSCYHKLMWRLSWAMSVSWSHYNSYEDWARMPSHQISGLVQGRCNSSVLAMELRLSCTNQLKWVTVTWLVSQQWLLANILYCIVLTKYISLFHTHGIYLSQEKNTTQP